MRLPTLVIGNKAYSSWSLRPWLALRQAGAEFEEVMIPLRQSDTKSKILDWSGAGKVPILRHGAVTIWESLAICEAIADFYPAGGLWPDDASTRAVARAVATEMHGGFAEIRKAFPMDLKRTPAARAVPSEAAAELERLTTLWLDLRGRASAAQGPFLFGRFTIADAMYAPVCVRIDTYMIPVDPVCRAYVDAILALPAMADWRAAALAEPWTLQY